MDNPAAQAESPIDSLVQLTFSGMRFNRGTRTFDSLATLTNTSTTPIYAPVYIAFYDFNPPSVSLYNATGTTPDGKQKLEVGIPDGVLDPGETLSNIVCKFMNPTFSSFTFSHGVYGVIGGGANQAPVAVAGPDQNVTVGDLVALDGSNSYDPDGDPITYSWSIRSLPVESGIALSDPASVAPTFVPDLEGTYIFDLVVNDGELDSTPDDTVVVAVYPNVPPTANAGSDQSVATGSTAFLDGTGSSDPDSDSLTYQWQFLARPAGSTAALDDPGSSTPSFPADLEGEYTIQLTVNDGQADSAPDDVVVISAAPNAPPVADAGPDQAVSVDSMISLDGAQSYDPDGDPLNCTWSIVSQPPGSISTLDNPISFTPQILADQVGDYVFRLVVNDGQLDSAPDTVVVTAGNDPPVAEAGPDRTVSVGTALNLNGNGSTDPNGDSLTYSWMMTSKPVGSSAALSNATSVTPSFTTDMAGTYTIELIVNDGLADSAPDTITVTAFIPNQNPTADPGDPYTGMVSIPVAFDGSGSGDLDGDPLSYSWDFGDGSPLGSGVKPSHTYAAPSQYIVTLTVEDGRGGTDTAQTTADISPLPPPPTITGFSPTQGPFGIVVAISGTNFDAATPSNNRVTFNGKSAILASATSTTLTTLVPVGATTGPIGVTTLGGAAVSSADFTVTRSRDFTLSAAPAAASVNPGGETTYTVSVSSADDFSDRVALSLQGLSTGVSGRLSPKSITAGQTSTLSLSASDAVASGSATLTITGTATIDGTAVTRSATVTLNILAPGTTTLTGRVLNTEGEPLQGVTIQLDSLSTTTDESGNFLLENPPTGEQVVLIDGGTASDTTAKYPTIPVTLNIQAGVTNPLPYIPHLHAQKDYNFTPITPTQETKVEDPEVPGFQMRIPAGVEIIGWDGQPNTKISVREVPIDRLPIPPPPPELQARSVRMFYFGKQGGGIPTVPIPVTTPNDTGLEPGQKAELWYYDESPNPGEAPNAWRMAGTVTVSADGKTTTTNPGVGIPRFCCGAYTVIPRNPTGDNYNPDSGCNGIGDPIDPATGMFLYESNDLTIPGRIPISITRTYRTRDTFRGPYGVGTYFGYDWYVVPSGDMATLVIPPGSRIRFSRQPDGSYVNTTQPSFLGARITFNPDRTSRLEMKDGTTYKFDAAGGILIEQTDRNGNKLTFLREVEGNVTKIIGTDGRLMVNIRIIILGRDVITEMTDILGRKVTYTYDYGTDPGTGRLMSVTNPRGGVTRYEYGAEGRMNAIFDPRNNLVVRNAYDANGRVCRQEHGDGGIFEYHYITADQATTPASLRLLDEAAAGDPITQAPCSAPVSSSPVVITVMVDPLGNTTTYRFDGSGFLLSTTDPLGQTTTHERASGSNLPLSTTDPLGRVSRFTYDDNGNLTSKTDPAGNTTTFTYEPSFNRVTTVTDALGQVTRFGYDARGNLTSVTDPLGNTTAIDYDSLGQPISVTDPLGNTITFEYDESGNLIAATDPLGNKTRRAYDAVSWMIALTDPNGRNTSFTYDPPNRVTQMVDSLGNATDFAYDPNGNLLSVTDANLNRRTYTYDVRNRLATMTDPLAKVESYSYDANDNLVGFTDRKGQITSYTYDAFNRRVGVTYADGSTTDYTYDTLGRLVRIDDSLSGPIEYTYTPFGCDTCGSTSPNKIIREATLLGTIDYSYDALGRRTSRVWLF